MREQFRSGLIGLCAVAGVVAGRADWPQYRGPNHDGSASTVIRTNWTEEPPTVLWKVPLGPGWSSPAVSGGRLFTQVRRTVSGSQREVTVALDANTGQELWSVDLDRAAYSDLAGYDDNLDGPRSTPTVEGDRVYVFTSHLKLACLTADDGEIVWQRDLLTELGGNNISWQNAQSPLLVGELIFLNGNAPGGKLMAIRKSDGTTAWRTGENNLTMTHATPAYARFQDEEQVIFLTLAGLVAVSPATGTERWRLAFSASPTSTAATPVVAGDFVYASAAYARGAWVAQVTTSDSGFAATQAWQQRGDLYQNHWATPVALNGFIYSLAGPGPRGVRLACLEAATGVSRWTQGTVGGQSPGYGSVQRVGSVLVVVTESGQVVLVAADPESYVELGVFATELSYCWNNAAITDGRIYLRNPEFALALEVSAARPPVPPLRLTAAPGNDGQTLELIVSAEGAVLDSEMTGQLELRSATSPLVAAASWLNVPIVFEAQPNGTLRTLVPVQAEQEFFQVREK